MGSVKTEIHKLFTCQDKRAGTTTAYGRTVLKNIDYKFLGRFIFVSIPLIVVPRRLSVERRKYYYFCSSCHQIAQEKNVFLH